MSNFMVMMVINNMDESSSILRSHGPSAVRRGSPSFDRTESRGRFPAHRRRHIRGAGVAATLQRHGPPGLDP